MVMRSQSSLSRPHPSCRRAATRPSLEECRERAARRAVPKEERLAVALGAQALWAQRLPGARVVRARAPAAARARAEVARGPTGPEAEARRGRPPARVQRGAGRERVEPKAGVAPGQVQRGAGRERVRAAALRDQAAAQVARSWMPAPRRPSRRSTQSSPPIAAIAIRVTIVASSTAGSI